MCISLIPDAVPVGEGGLTLPKKELHSKSQTFNLSPVGYSTLHGEFCPSTNLYRNQWEGWEGLYGKRWMGLGGVSLCCPEIEDTRSFCNLSW